jgi:hypothetical protein
MYAGQDILESLRERPSFFFLLPSFRKYDRVHSEGTYALQKIYECRGMPRDRGKEVVRFVESFRDRKREVIGSQTVLLAGISHTWMSGVRIFWYLDTVIKVRNSFSAFVDAIFVFALISFCYD